MSASVQRPPVAAADIPEDWIDKVRVVVRRDGNALRPGTAAHTIEVQSINAPERWLPLMLPSNGTSFVSAGDRDAVLGRIQRGK